MKNENIKKLADTLQNIKLEEEIRIMEVCGTHTMEFFKTGVKDIFPDNLTLIDGPGCPVCVTSNVFLDRAIEIGKKYNPIITTFGDMIKVPSSYSSLRDERSKGMDVEIVYSPLDALTMAEKNKDREIIFLSVGIETTAPTEAVAVMEAKKRNLKNFSILSGNKLTPPAVSALLDTDEVKIDGFILPGHVSIITGADAWNFVHEKFNRPSVIAGFEAEDLLMGVLSLLKMFKEEKIELQNVYKKLVSSKGNTRAQELLFDVFNKTDADWRGIGIIPESGLELKDQYKDFDSAKKFPVDLPETKEHPGCRCGDLLRGLILPPDCPLFDKGCAPESPIGPCMVSSEGPCSAYYKYWRH